MENATGPTAAGLALPSLPSYSLTLESWGLLSICDRQPQEWGDHCPGTPPTPTQSSGYFLVFWAWTLFLFLWLQTQPRLSPMNHHVWLHLGLLRSFYLECPSQPFICLVNTCSGFSSQLKYSPLQETFPRLPGLFRALLREYTPLNPSSPLSMPHAASINAERTPDVIVCLFHQTGTLSREDQGPSYVLALALAQSAAPVWLVELEVAPEG